VPTPRKYTDDAARQKAYRERQAKARRAEQQAKGLPPAPPIPTIPSRQRWDALLDQARLALEIVRDEMQAYHDDRSDAWQQSERAESMQDCITTLDRILDDVGSLPNF
jgi:hypothetical protein